MHRREFLHHSLWGAGAAAALPLTGAHAATAPGAADQSSREFHIAMVTFRGETDVDKGFRDYLAQAGLRLRYSHYDLAQDSSRLPAIVAALRQERPDLIYTWGTPVTLGIVGPWDTPDPQGQFIRDIPVVFALVAAPVRARIVPQLQTPGRNVTGAVHVVPFAVQLRVMQRYHPFEKLGVLYNGAEANSQAIVDEAQSLCAQNAITLLQARFHTNAQGQPLADGVEDLIAELRAQGAQWLYLLPDTFLGSLYSRITPAAQQAQLPCFGAAELAVRSGAALVGLVSRYYSVGQLAGAKAQAILVGGQSPANIPVQTLQRFSLLVNMPVAHQLRLYPPIDMLNYAEVIA